MALLRVGGVAPAASSGVDTLRRAATVSAVARPRGSWYRLGPIGRVRNFLRYGQLVIELANKPLTLGRSSACDVIVEDELASREHCRITADGDRIVLEDLGSTNGVLVNGVKVNGSAQLYHGDAITIGTQQLVLMRQHRAPRVTPVMGETRQAFHEDETSSLEATSQGDIFQILNVAAVRSLEMNDLTSAESSARSLFVSLRASVSRSRPLPPGALDSAVALALAIAEHTNEVRWLEQILELLTLARAPMKTGSAASFATLARRIGRPKGLEDYVRIAREIGAASTVDALTGL